MANERQVLCPRCGGPALIVDRRVQCHRCSPAVSRRAVHEQPLTGPAAAAPPDALTPPDTAVPEARLPVFQRGATQTSAAAPADDPAFDAYYKWLGIPPQEQPPHYYQLLGLRSFEHDDDVIANAADQRMAHVRTFQNSPRAAESQVLLNELARARNCLLNPQQKLPYDEHLRRQLAAASVPQPQSITPFAPQPVPMSVQRVPMSLPGTGQPAVLAAASLSGGQVSKHLPAAATGHAGRGTSSMLLFVGGLALAGGVAAVTLAGGLAGLFLLRNSSVPPANEVSARSREAPARPAQLDNVPTPAASREQQPPQPELTTAGTATGSSLPPPNTIVTASPPPAAKMARRSPPRRVVMRPRYDPPPAGGGDATQTASSASGTTSAAEPAAAKTAVPLDPLQTFPAAFTLPSLLTTVPQTLADFATPVSGTCTLGIIGSAADLPDDESYAIEPQTDDPANRLWTVLLTRQQDGAPSQRLAVAQIAVTDQQLQFHWLDRAATRATEQLQNCVVRINVGSHSGAFALRAPVRSKNELLSLEKAVDMHTFELSHLPALKSLHWELVDVGALGVPASVENNKSRGRLNEDVLVSLTSLPGAELRMRLAHSGQDEVALRIAPMYSQDSVSHDLSLSRLETLGATMNRTIAQMQKKLVSVNQQAAAANARLSAAQRLPANNLAQQAIKANTINTISTDLATLAKSYTITQKNLADLQVRLKQLPKLQSTVDALHQKAKLHYRVFAVADSYEIDLFIAE